MMASISFSSVRTRSASASRSASRAARRERVVRDCRSPFSSVARRFSSGIVVWDDGQRTTGDGRSFSFYRPSSIARGHYLHLPFEDVRGDRAEAVRVLGRRDLFEGFGGGLGVGGGGGARTFERAALLGGAD